MPECYGSGKKPCESRMCNDLFELFFNTRNCRSGPKHKYVTVFLHIIGCLFGLGNFYSGRHYIGIMQLMHGLLFIFHHLPSYDRRSVNECRDFLKSTTFLWTFIEVFITVFDYKVDGNGCPLYI